MSLLPCWFWRINTNLDWEVLFLNYNLDLFGKKMEQIRKNLNLTQKKICELAGIDSVTIRRIENGKVVPKLDTLEILSPIYKQDLINLLLKYRFDDYLTFYEIKNRLEFKLDSVEFNTLHNEFKELNILLLSTKNNYYKVIIKQLILFTEAILLYKNNSDMDNKALNMLIESLKMTTPRFDLNDYNSFVYSSMEIRILMNIAFILNRLNLKEKYLEIMEFCFQSTDINDEIYPKLCHNLAGVYRRNKDFEKALKFSNIGIRVCQEVRNLNGLNLLYYGKGIAEFHLKKSEYIQSLNVSITLCEALGQNKLKDEIIENCREIFGIDL